MTKKELKEYNDLISEYNELYKENKELKKRLEEYEKQLKPNYYVKGLEDTLKEYQHTMTKYDTQQKEFIDYLENEKDRLVRDCSQIYEDFLGKTRLVSEDIFNEVDTILSKYKEIIGGK